MLTQRTAVQGLEVPVEIWGSSSETLVFLPGLGAHPRYYRKGLERLAHDLRIVVPDLSFRSHRRLPSNPLGYLAIVQQIALDLAPDAVWSGHSFGGLLALMSDRPAIACAPSVPAQVSLPRMFSRALRLQLREVLGREGRNGFVYAPRIMVDYVSAALLRPGSLFPPVGSLRTAPGSYRPSTPRAVVYISARDELYREADYDSYFLSTPGADVTDAGSHRPQLEVITLADCHDWPSLHPERFATRLWDSHQRIMAA